MSNKRKKYQKHPYSVQLQVVTNVLCEHLPLHTVGKMFDVNPRQVNIGFLYTPVMEKRGYVCIIDTIPLISSLKYYKMNLKFTYLYKKPH